MFARREKVLYHKSRKERAVQHVTDDSLTKGGVKMLQVLLVCGAGASTGFIAQAARKAAKKQGLDMKIEARSTAHLDAYLESIDVLLLGSHYAYKENDIRQQIAGKPIVMGVVPQSIFGRIDGEGLVEFIKELCAANDVKV